MKFRGLCIIISTVFFSKNVGLGYWFFDFRCFVLIQRYQKKTQIRNASDSGKSFFKRIPRDMIWTEITSSFELCDLSAHIKHLLVYIGDCIYSTK